MSPRTVLIARKAVEAVEQSLESQRVVVFV
jgi:hypothetical protein